MFFEANRLNATLFSASSSLVFLFPTATLLRNKELADAAPDFPLYAVVEILLFVGILVLGLAFAWVKGYLNWEKPESSAEKLNIPIPDRVYDNIRTKHSSAKNVS